MTTHLCMNGSPSLRITNYEEFYKSYIHQVSTGKKLYLVETKTPLFRFFIDLDYTSPCKLEKHQIIEITRRISETIPGRCLCAISSPVKKGSLVKSGIHIHFPECIVTKQKALKLRQELPKDLLEFVDDSVYKGSGLRMLWSYKKDGGAPYVPFWDVQNNCYFDQQPNIDTLKLFSIKTEYSFWSDETVENAPHTKLENFIQRCIPHQENIKIKKIDKMFIHTDSRYCSCIQKEHKSNHIYFMFNHERTRIHQRCFDENCKNFRGREYRLSVTALDELKNLSSE